MLEEHDAQGTLNAHYVYGHNLLSQTRGTSTNYYHYDGLSSPRLLSDASGTITDTYAYDAYGLLLDSTGSTRNPYRYRGEQYDPELNAYYLRARYYQPGIGRFLTVDPFEGSQSMPITQHRYVYGNADPVVPSGQFGLAVMMATTAISNEIMRIAQVSEKEKIQLKELKKKEATLKAQKFFEYPIIVEAIADAIDESLSDWEKESRRTEPGGWFYQNVDDELDIIFIEMPKGDEGMTLWPKMDDYIKENGKKYKKFVNFHTHPNVDNVAMSTDDSLAIESGGGRTTNNHRWLANKRFHGDNA